MISVVTLQFFVRTAELLSLEFRGTGFERCSQVRFVWQCFAMQAQQGRHEDAVSRWRRIRILRFVSRITGVSARSQA